MHEAKDTNHESKLEQKVLEKLIFNLQPPQVCKSERLGGSLLKLEQESYIIYLSDIHGCLFDEMMSTLYSFERKTLILRMVPHLDLHGCCQVDFQAHGSH